MTSRQQFIARVRDALGRTSESAAPPPPPPDVAVDDAIVRTCGAEEDLVERFAARAAGVGMEVRRCSSAELPQRLVDVLGELGAGRIVCNAERLAPEVIAAMDAADIQRLDWHGDRTMATDYEAAASVTDVAAAIAESGTLVYCSEPTRPRGLMIVPPAHVAIVRADQIVPDLLDHLRNQPTAERPALENLITGPSKTADIEGILVTGVHGPGRVIVMLVA